MVSKERNTNEGFSFNLLYKRALKAGLKTSRRPEFRASSMPFCGRKYIFKYFEYLTQDQISNYAGSFYCEVGTAIHSAIQFWTPLGTPGYYMGSWKCPICGRIENYKVGPLFCCKTPMIYEEFSLNLPDAPVTGHSDGLLLNIDHILAKLGITRDEAINHIDRLNKIIREKKLKKKIPTWVLELKSSSTYKATKLAAPLDEHKCQATVYTTTFRKVLADVFGLHNLDVKGFIVKYISRDNPQITSKDFEILVNDTKLYDLTCDVVNKTIRSFNLGKCKKLYLDKPCSEAPAYYPNCPYGDFCGDISFGDFKDMFKKVRIDFLKERDDSEKKKKKG